MALAARPGAVSAGAESAPKAEAAPSDEGQGLLKLGASLTERGDCESAVIAYRRVLDGRDFPLAEQGSAMFGLARTYRKAGDPTKAAALYEKFIKEFPSDDCLPDAYLELGRTLRSMGANKLALNRFYSVINSTLKLPPTGFAHYQSLARTAEYEIAETFYENGDYARAGEYFKRLQLLNLSPADTARASFMAAHSLILAEDLQNGCKSLHLFLETWPGNENVPEAEYLLATTLRRLKKPQESLAIVLDLLRQEKSKDGADPQVWAYWQRRTGNLLANDFFQSGDTMSALSIYQGMIGLGVEPEWQLPVLYQVGLCQERLLNLEAAGAAYRRIIEVAGAAGASPKPEIAELAQMAQWRLKHIEWLQNTDMKLVSFAGIPGPARAAAAAEHEPITTKQ
jgi:TolA-binding protein